MTADGATISGIRYDIETPPGAEGWESMYPSYLLFGDELRERDEQKLWFFDQMHNPEPLYPFDLMMPESWLVSLNQYTTRVWNLPTALGIEQRIVNGYLYLSPNVIDDPAVIAEREPIFAERARHYFENWDEIYDQWVAKATDCIERLKAMQFEPLAEREPERTGASRTGARPRRSTCSPATAAYLENMHEMAYYHFEMLNLAYGAYLTFLEFCRSHFPAITDDLVARMVAGIDVILYRPDAELRRLAAQRRRARRRRRARLAGRAGRGDRGAGGQRAPARSGWPSSSRSRTRGSTTRPAPATAMPTGPGSTTCARRSPRCATTCPGSSAARTCPGRSSTSAPSASGSPPATGSCSTTRTRPPSTVCWRCPARSSLSSRTTTSTSSTGTTRSSSTRCASSAR